MTSEQLWGLALVTLGMPGRRPAASHPRSPAGDPLVTGISEGAEDE